MAIKEKQRGCAPVPPHFEGLWLCRKTTPDEDGVTFRHALLFATRGPELFLLRFNHSDLDEGGMTFYFDYDYKLSPGIMHQHPLGYPERFRVRLAWNANNDGSLVLRYRHGRADRFFPAKWDEVFSLGFERDEIKEALREANEAGWSYPAEARFPDFAQSSKSTK